MSTIDWNGRALDFIRASFAVTAKVHGNDSLKEYLVLVKSLIMADVVLQVSEEDAFVAKVSHAVPGYLEGISFPVEKLLQTLKIASQDILYLPDLSRMETEFSEVLVAMYSAVMIPLDQKKNSTLLIIGWSAQQHFTPSFKSFLSIIREKLRENARLSYYRSVTDKNIDLMAAVFHKMRQAIIYIDDDGYTSWINFAAAALLHLPIYGRQSSALIAGALQDLRKRAVNNADIEARARELFASRYLTIDQWIWKFDHPEIDYKHLCVSTRAVKSSGNSGRLWIFDDTSGIADC